MKVDIKAIEEYMHKYNHIWQNRNRDKVMLHQKRMKNKQPRRWKCQETWREREREYRENRQRKMLNF